MVERGVKALNNIYRMTERIPHLMKQSHLESSEAWSAYWLPVFQALTTQCTNPCREIRHLAFSSLQRSLLLPELMTTSSSSTTTTPATRTGEDARGERQREDRAEWTAIFGEVLSPLILRLLKPEVFSSDRDGMSETRVQAASLLSKVFLQYLVALSEWDGMLDLWVKIIEIMDRLMNSGQGDSLVRFFFFAFLSFSCAERIVTNASPCFRRRPSRRTSKMSYSSCRAMGTSCRRARTRRAKSCGTRHGSGLIGSCLA